MKRLIALLLALSALFSLAACGGTNAFALAEATYPESAPYPNEAKYSGAKYFAPEYFASFGYGALSG